MKKNKIKIFLAGLVMVVLIEIGGSMVNTFTNYSKNLQNQYNTAMSMINE